MLEGEHALEDPKMAPFTGIPNIIDFANVDITPRKIPKKNFKISTSDFVVVCSKSLWQPKKF